MAEIKIKKEAKTKSNLNIDEMLKAGLHFGHRASNLHPKMEAFVHGIRKTVHIIDLDQTLEKLEQALEFIKQLSQEDKILLFVGTKIQHKALVKNIAEECNSPYVIERWLGGTLTNFEIIIKRIAYFKEIEAKKESGEFEKYTKKEQIKIGKELDKLRIKFGGIKNLDKLPDAVFVCHMKKDDLAAKEARIKKIPVIGICDTNIDPTLADYSIPANDDAISSVRYILEKVKETISEAKSSKKSDKKSK